MFPSGRKKEERKTRRIKKIHERKRKTKKRDCRKKNEEKDEEENRSGFSVFCPTFCMFASREKENHDWR